MQGDILPMTHVIDLWAVINGFGAFLWQKTENTVVEVIEGFIMNLYILTSSGRCLLEINEYQLNEYIKKNILLMWKRRSPLLIHWFNSHEKVIQVEMFIHI